MLPQMISLRYSSFTSSGPAGDKETPRPPNKCTTLFQIIKDELWPNPLQSFLINNKHPDDSDEEDADDSG